VPLPNLPEKKALPYLGWPLRCAPNFSADQANKTLKTSVARSTWNDQCIDCDLCRETARANFKRNDDGGTATSISTQSDAETALCKEAMEGCPVEAIGSDGPN
jgi:ferredoxin